MVIVGISNHAGKVRRLYSIAEDGGMIVKGAENINAYLVVAENVEVHAVSKPLSDLATMQFGNHPYYGSALIFSQEEARKMVEKAPQLMRYIRPFYGSKEFITSLPRACLWIEEGDAKAAMEIPQVASRVQKVIESRKAARRDKTAQILVETPYRFREQIAAKSQVLVVPRVSSEKIGPTCLLACLGRKALFKKKPSPYMTPPCGTWR